MTAKTTCNGLIKSVYRFTLEKLENLSFQNINPNFFDETFQENFFLESSKEC